MASPYHNEDAERSLLGGVLLRNETLDLVAHVSPDDFYDPKHREIFAAMLSLHADESPIDAVTLGDRLGDKLQAVGGYLFLSELAQLVPTADNIEHYAEIVTTDALTRRVRIELSGLASNLHLDGRELLAAAERSIAAIKARAPSEASADTYCTPLLDFIGDGEPTEEEEENQWIIKGILARAVPNLFVGGPKASKTLVSLHMALCMAAGYPWLGFPTTCSRVLVLAHEDPKFETRRRIWRLARGLELDPRALHENLMVRDRQPPFRFDDPLDLARMQRTLAEFRPDVVFTDSLSRAHRQDENSVSEMKVVTDIWMDMCTRHNVAFACLHHTNKTTGSVRGSGEIFAAARHMVTFMKKDGQVVVSTDGNMAATPEPFAIEARDRVINGHNAICITRATEPTLDPEVANVLDKKILAWLSTHGPTHTDPLRKELKCNRDVLMSRLIALKETGAITRPSTRHKWILASDQGKQTVMPVNGKAAPGSAT